MPQLIALVFALVAGAVFLFSSGVLILTAIAIALVACVPALLVHSASNHFRVALDVGQIVTFTILASIAFVACVWLPARLFHAYKGKIVEAENEIRRAAGERYVYSHRAGDEALQLTATVVLCTNFLAVAVLAALYFGFHVEYVAEFYRWVSRTSA